SPLYCLGLACGTALGVMFTLVGQQVLLAARGGSWAVAPHIVARIGAVGGSIASLVLLAVALALEWHYRPRMEDRFFICVTAKLLVPSLCFGPAAGALGCFVLNLDEDSGLAADQAGVAGLVGSAVLVGGSFVLSLLYEYTLYQNQW
ncbi:hypothetical protein BD626DRAFT_520043, partial [Schizophyllum amplum]